VPLLNAPPLLIISFKRDTEVREENLPTNMGPRKSQPHFEGLCLDEHQQPCGVYSPLCVTPRFSKKRGPWALA